METGETTKMDRRRFVLLLGAAAVVGAIVVARGSPISLVKGLPASAPAPGTRAPNQSLLYTRTGVTVLSDSPIRP